MQLHSGQAVGLPHGSHAPGAKAPRAACCHAGAARDRGRDARGRGASVSSTWLVPSRLVAELHSKGAEQSVAAEPPLTVLTIRLHTGTARQSALSDPYSAVNLCLIGQDGTAVMHRIPPVNDPIESRAHTVEMCQLIGPDVGADCSGVTDDPSPSGSQQPPQPSSSSTTPAWARQQQQQPAAGGSGAGAGVPQAGRGHGSLVGRPPPPPPPKRRFQEGMVDEVSILVPEVGPLGGVLVGVEGGTWYLDELDVVSSRTARIDRFVCRRMLGGVAGEGAALLSPVPPDAVIYGQGEAAVTLTKEQAAALWSFNMADYTDLKRRLAATTALLVASGASLAALTGGTGAALPYAAGGVVGLVYQWLLMRGVDHVMEAATGTHTPADPAAAAEAEAQRTLVEETDGEEAAVAFDGRSADGQAVGPRAGVPPSLRLGATSSRLLASAPLRLGLVCASAAVGLALLSQEEAATGGAGGASLPSSGAHGAAALQLALAALGFLTYKVALVGVSLSDAGKAGGGGLGLGLGGGAMARSASSRSGSAAELEKYKRD